MSLYGGGVGGVGGRVTGRGYAPACAGLEAQDSYELRVTTHETTESKRTVESTKRKGAGGAAGPFARR